MKTIVLAYSGGLDTSIIVPWLREHYDAEVVCVAADVGQGDELEGVREKAIASGASACYIADLREEFVRDFCFPTLRAGAIYNRKYLLGTSMARPLIARKQVEVARQVGADALAHGCTGKGNDQVRFELTYMAFAPDLPVIAPWRIWDIRSREQAIAYAASHNVPVSATAKKIYSRDRNIWHMSHEGGLIEDPNSVPADDVFQLTTDPALAPDLAGRCHHRVRGRNARRRQWTEARPGRAASGAEHDRRPARHRPDRPRRGSPRRHEIARRLRDAGRNAACTRRTANSRCSCSTAARWPRRT